MVLDPYHVEAPFLVTVPSEDVEYFDLIQKFASQRLAAIAKSVIYRMQRMPAVGCFEDTARPLKSVWDEWCWYQAKYNSDCGILSYGFEQTLDHTASDT